jgi:putative redox protein
MATSRTIYLGELRTENEHIRSGKKLITDAPVDNQGKGDAFSPTDLVATALSDCIMTIMGIKARDKGLNLEGTTIETTKIMSAEPRRIGEIIVEISFPKNNFSEKDKAVFEAVVKTCPVALSLHPDVKQTVRFNW